MKKTKKLLVLGSYLLHLPFCYGQSLPEDPCNCLASAHTCLETPGVSSSTCSTYYVACLKACRIGLSSSAASISGSAMSTLTLSLRTHPGSAGQENSEALAADFTHNPERGYLVQAEKQNTLLPSGSALILAKEKNHHVLWSKGFYQNIEDTGQTLNSFGGYLGYDYLYSTGMISGMGGYSQSVLKKTKTGSGHVDFVPLAIHGVAQMPLSTYFEYGLASSINFNHFNRNISPTTIAKSSFTSYTLDPHFDFGYDGNVSDWCILEPFVSTDFIFNFQNAYSEQGASGFDLHYQSQNIGLFRLEPGLNIYEHWEKNGAELILRQKVSYVRKQVVYGTSTQIAFVGDPEDISVDTGLISQNFISASAQLFARLKQGPFLSLIYRGEWGNEFQLNEVRLRIGSYF